MSAPLRAALLMAATSLVGALGQAAAPPFEAFCGYPYGATVGWPHDTEFRSYYERNLVTRDESVAPLVVVPLRDDCPPQPQTTWLEAALHESMTWLLGLGFAQPGPELVGPMVRAEGVFIGPTDRVRVYLNDRPYDVRADAATPIHRGNAFIFGATCRDGRIVPSLPFLTAGVTKLRRDDHVGTTVVAAHEVAHVIQQGQPLWLSRTSCAAVPLWVLEGSAHALAAAYVRTKWPDVTPGLKDPNMLLGLRSYRNRPLVDDDAPRNRLPYYTSGFWSWLAERYGQGASSERRYGFLAQVMSKPLIDPAAPDWLAWLDDGLSEQSTWGIGRSLTLLFPSFLASYADWGTSRWPHIGNNSWRGYAFGGCDFVGLSLAHPTVTLRVNDVASLTGRCVTVRMSGDGIAADQPVWYSVRATSDDVEKVDDLHLASVERGGRVGAGVATRCHLEEERLVRSGRRNVVACLIEAKTAAQEGERPMRYWVAEKRTGGDWSDVLVLARSPHPLTDALQAALGRRSYDVVFSLETATLSIDGRKAGSTMGGANWRTPGVTGPPVLAAEGVPGPAGLDPSRLMFGQQAPGAMALGIRGPTDGGGLFTVQVRSGDSDGDDIGRAFAFWSRGEGVPYGATGTFGGWVITGIDGSRSGESQGPTLSSSEPTAVLTVYAWDADRVHLAVTGTWCYDDERRYDRSRDRYVCPVDRHVDAELWLAFGDTYDGDRPYVSLDTPVQALYREAFAEAAGFGPSLALPTGTDRTSPGDPGAGAGGGGGAAGGVVSTFECACTCAGLAELERIAPTVGPTGDPALVGAITQCALRCMAEFARCED